MIKTELKIRLYGDPALRKKAKPVDKVTEYHRHVLSQMSRLMYADNGVGLASSQVAVEDALIVADIGTGLYKMVNPRIAKRSGSQVNQEGCLSIPGVCVKVRRAQEVCVHFLDETGKPQTIQAQGLLACVLQHEIDHLKGRVIADYAGFIEKIKIKKKLESLKKKVKNEYLDRQEEKSCKLQL
jgi:peptide deformylase